MTVIRKTIGRLPVNVGDYDSTKAYGKKNRVNLYGCEWESKIENNTYAPATLVDGEVVPDTQHWRLNSGVPSNYNLNIEVGQLETDVDDLKSAVGTGGSVDTRISDAVSAEASARSSADTALDNRITPLETAIGTGGNVDSRISSAVNAEKVRAQSVEATKANADDVYSRQQGTAFENSITSTVNQKFQEQNQLINNKFAEQDVDMSDMDSKLDNIQTIVNEKQLEIGAVETDLEPIKNSPNRLTSGTLYDVYGGYDDSTEFIRAITDMDNKLIEATKPDGTKVFKTPVVILDTMVDNIENPEFINVLTTYDKKIIAWINKDGTVDWAIGVPGPIKDYILNTLKSYNNKDKDKLYRSYVLEHMISVGIPVSEERAITAVPTGCDVDSNGNVYLALQCGHGYDENVATGHDFSTLTVFNLLDPQATKKYYDFIAYGDTYIRNGEVVTILKGAQVDVKKIDDNTLRMYGNARVDDNIGPWSVIYRDFNLNTKTFGDIHQCTITVNGTNYALEGANAETLVSLLHNETFPMDEKDPSTYKYNAVYFNQNAIKIDDYWYTSFIIGSGGHALLRTNNLINWEYVTDIPIGYYCEEVTLNYYNGYIYAVNRGLRSTYTSTPYPKFGKVLRYNLASRNWDSSQVILEDSYGNKTSAAIKDGTLYCYLGVEKLNGQIDGYNVGRNGKSMYVVDCENMTLTNRWDFTMQRGCCDTMLVNLNCNLFMFASMDPRGFMKWPKPASVVRMSGCTANAFSCKTNNHVVPATFTEYILNSTYWAVTERVSAPSYNEIEVYNSNDIVNMDGCSTVSFRCIANNTSGKVPATFSNYTLDSHWASIDYDASFEVFQTGTNYTQKSECQGRSGVLFSYLDNRMFN